jgi:segregation and condensation protein A
MNADAQRSQPIEDSGIEDQAIDAEGAAAQIEIDETVMVTSEEIAEVVAIATIRGVPVTELPQDLYIPPDALRVVLEAFEGPLDLLLYLIRRQNLNILDIPIAHITEQYMQYVDVMRAIDIELAGEYLVMAALLAEIKSRMLLPRHEESDDEDDPRAELVRRLQEYERFKQAAEDLNVIPRMERDTWQAQVRPPERNAAAPPELDLQELLFAFSEVMSRAELFSSHHIQQEPLSVRERMGLLLERVRNATEYLDFQSLFTLEEGRAGVVVSLLAVLELVKERMLEVVQPEAFAPIYVRAAQAKFEGMEEPAFEIEEFATDFDDRDANDANDKDEEAA